MTAQSTHTEAEDHAWTISIGDHAKRADTPLYHRSRKHMITAVQACQPWYFGPPPYQDHHGGGVWVHDGRSPLLLLLPAGIEWSAQFCADPAKVDSLRSMAERLVVGFPQTAAWYAELGMTPEDLAILHTPITTPEHVAAWTDSFWNASVPLPADAHTGVLPKAAGYHHYPKPIVDIETFKHDDFVLFVGSVAVAPVAPRGAGIAAVRVLYDPSGKHHDGQELDANHPVTRAAFADQPPLPEERA